MSTNSLLYFTTVEEVVEDVYERCSFGGIESIVTQDVFRASNRFSAVPIFTIGISRNRVQTKMMHDLFVLLFDSFIIIELGLHFMFCSVAQVLSSQLL